MAKRMSIEARAVYVERRVEDRERTIQRKRDRRAAAFVKGGRK